MYDPQSERLDRQSPESGPKLAAVGFEIHVMSQFIAKVRNPCALKSKSVQLRSLPSG